jgi:RNA polymerase sigma-70 factor (ECF subfamily)
MTILAGMTRLTDNQRTAIQLRYLAGYPRDRAAEVMGRSTQAVRDLERRGLRRLNAALALPPADATAAVTR